MTILLLKNFKDYSDDVLSYIIKSQKMLSKWIFIFFISYGIIAFMLDINTSVLIIPNKIVYFLECIISLLGYYLFGFYFKKNKKYAFISSYLNIFLILFFLEFQYFNSYTLIICIIMATTVTIMGPSVYFFFTILAILSIDTFITIMHYGNTVSALHIFNYILDNIFVLSFSTWINMFFCKIKYTDIKLKNELTYLSETDGLTKLLNRQAAKNFVNKNSKMGNDSAMLILDLDNFKLVNDNFGHMKGDDLLKEVSSNLKKIFKDTDCISRLGGDEFMIFIPTFKDEEYVINKAKEIINSFPIYVHSEEEKIEVTCSIGIALSKDCKDSSYETLYKKADLAMYEAKNSGKNQFIIYTEKEF